MKRLIILLLFSISFMLAEAQVKVKIDSMAGYEGYEKFAFSAASLLEDVLNSDEFKTRVLQGNYTWTNRMSNEEIYNYIMKAHEKYGQGGEDNVVNLRLRTMSLEIDGKGWMDNCDLNSSAGTIGKDGGGSGVAAICPERLKLWYSKNNTADLAGHYAHEYLHILGFSHPVWGGWRQRKTLVYQIGDLISELAEQRLKEKIAQ